MKDPVSEDFESLIRRAAGLPDQAGHLEMQHHPADLRAAELKLKVKLAVRAENQAAALKWATVALAVAAALQLAFGVLEWLGPHP